MADRRAAAEHSDSGSRTGLLRRRRTQVETIRTSTVASLSRTAAVAFRRHVDPSVPCARFPSRGITEPVPRPNVGCLRGVDTMRPEDSKTALFAAAVLAAFAVCATTGKPARTSRLAKYTTLCRISDSQLNQCMTSAMKDILKHARTGIPELNIPALEPFVIQEIDLKVFRGLGDSLFGGGGMQKSDKYKAFARNLVVHHSSEFILHNFNTDIEKKEFFIDVSFPKLRIVGEYDVNLVMFNIPIKSTGPVYINATDTSVKATLNGKTVKRKEVKYLQFDSIDIKVDFKDYSILIENMFKKDQNLNRALNDMIRTQKAELRKLTMPMIEEVAGKMIINMINLVLKGLPFDEIFIAE